LFSIIALLAMTVLYAVGRWYQNHLFILRTRSSQHAETSHQQFSATRVATSIGILLTLLFSKYFYTVSLSNYYIFYLMGKFGISLQAAQIYLFVFLGSVAIGTLAGGPVGDKIGFKTVIWASILGVLPFSLALPYANLFWTGVLTVPIGLIMASAFSAIMVYAQELVASRVGTIAGLFFGFAFGMAGIAAAVLGVMADRTSINFVYQVCSFFPAIGLLAGFLPNLDKRK